MISTTARSNGLHGAALLCLLLAPSIAAVTEATPRAPGAPPHTLGDRGPGGPILWHDHLRNGRNGPTPARA